MSRIEKSIRHNIQAIFEVGIVGFFLFNKTFKS